MLDTVLILLGIIIGLIILIHLGLLIQPASFPRYPKQKERPNTIPLPEGLPVPVKRFFGEIYGSGIPVITSAVITGKVKMRPTGNITFPGRFRFTHRAGQDYRHYIEATLFGLPVMKVNERYVDGVSRMEIPFSVSENEPKVNQGANLGLWGESIWFPSIFLTDPRVRWEPVNDHTAVLLVPFEDTQEHIIVRFDPETGMIHAFEAMRYKGENSQSKVLWICEAKEWGMVNNLFTLKVGALTWFGDPRPWAIFTIEDIVYNADINDYIQAKGI